MQKYLFKRQAVPHMKSLNIFKQNYIAIAIATECPVWSSANFDQCLIPMVAMNYWIWANCCWHGHLHSHWKHQIFKVKGEFIFISSFKLCKAFIDISLKFKESNTHEFYSLQLNTNTNKKTKGHKLATM